jgi:hypothetical protein
MELLPEKVGFKCKENLSAFNLAEIESLSLRFVCSRHDWIAERRNVISEFLSVVDDFSKYLLFVRLERKRRDLILPSLKIF